MENEYDIYRPFDAEKHKAKYSNYLEVLILEDRTVVYAIPSHQEKAIALACGSTDYPGMSSWRCARENITLTIWSGS